MRGRKTREERVKKCCKRKREEGRVKEMEHKGRNGEMLKERRGRV